MRRYSWFHSILMIVIFGIFSASCRSTGRKKITRVQPDQLPRSEINKCRGFFLATEQGYVELNKIKEELNEIGKLHDNRHYFYDNKTRYDGIDRRFGQSVQNYSVVKIGFRPNSDSAVGRFSNDFNNVQARLASKYRMEVELASSLTGVKVEDLGKADDIEEMFKQMAKEVGSVYNPNSEQAKLIKRIGYLGDWIDADIGRLKLRKEAIINHATDPELVKQDLHKRWKALPDEKAFKAMAGAGSSKVWGQIIKSPEHHDVLLKRIDYGIRNISESDEFFNALDDTDKPLYRQAEVIDSLEKIKAQELDIYAKARAERLKGDIPMKPKFSAGTKIAKYAGAASLIAALVGANYYYLKTRNLDLASKCN